MIVMAAHKDTYFLTRLWLWESAAFVVKVLVKILSFTPER